MKRQQLLTAKILYQIVCERPGVSYEQLSELSTYAPNTCRTLCVDMQKRGLVDLQKDSPKDLAGKAIGRAVTCVFPATDTAQYAEFQGTRRVVSIAPSVDHSAELEELRAFKERAITKYPDLALDPRTKQARELLAKHTAEGSVRDGIIAGEYDDSPPMKAVLELIPA